MADSQSSAAVLEPVRARAIAKYVHMSPTKVRRVVAMNPIDHPHGGGEGKTSGGRHPVNPSGKPEGRTRRTKPSDKLIVRRRRTGKKR